MKNFPAYTCFSDINKDLKNNTVSCIDIVKLYLNKINENKHLNAFIEVFEDEVLNRAKIIDKKLKDGTSGKLAGMVIGIKDNLAYKDHKLSAGSKILENFVSIYNSTVVERLLKEDAIIIGRLNCDEFAMGSSNENSAFGAVLNPIDNTKVPGGSSGGAAAAVKAGLCLAALGTDTGGSIRQPASFCDVIGLKPSYGRVSRYGCIAYSSSCDQIGPIANNIEDVALLLEVIAGKDDYDSTMSSRPVPIYSKILEHNDFSKSSGKYAFKIAFLKDYFDSKYIDIEIKNRIFEIIDLLKKKGHIVKAFDFPYLKYLVPTYQIITTAEASSNLSRYDGIHYGYRSRNAKDLKSTYIKSRTEGFGEEVKRRIMLGTFVLSAGYYDKYYEKAQKLRRIIKDKTYEIFNEADFILLPTTRSTAFGIGEIQNPIKMYLQDIFTIQANLSGIPAISLPLGHHSNGLPFGIQIMSHRFEEDKLLVFSKYMMNNFS